MESPGPRDHPTVTLLDCPFTQDDLPRLRMLVDQYADREGLPEPRRGEFIVAVDAVATNAIEHATGSGTLFLRRADGHLECRIHDTGPGFTADVIPSLAPGIGGHAAGRGLWIATLVTDQLTISAETGGATVTLFMRLPC
ncbi:ATP-binding protein [Streptomyces endophyticus]|uniref:ATP-binding protein n=1 Tax=Streptomyces endophyticus TaxID=714166 RepID=A0ABU6F5U3_9ACTN|nr:ATP-binding protein [Streptomyces endophyticus]MEB8339333.1 ATP-binding protein [Streptomyces endophyticus]